MIPVILSGGSGSRLWPLSRTQYPKQFLSLDAGLSLFQSTLGRFSPYPGVFSAAMIVCNHEHRFLVAEQCRAISSRPLNIMLEPKGRNTAPAIAAVVSEVLRDKDDLLLVVPADHVIRDQARFIEAVKNAEVLAEKGYIVTFGVKPTYPETGYGYIEVAEASDQAQSVVAFVEKPNAEIAAGYLAGSKHYWNSGMFLFKASVMRDELLRLEPELLEQASRAVARSSNDLDFLRLNEEDFIQCQSISIDYAVMERTSNVMMVPLTSDWNDVGVWSSVWDVSEKDLQGNATKGDVLLQNVENSYVHAEHRMVAVSGMADVVVVETADAVLVTRKQCSQEVKGLVEKIKATSERLAVNHRKVYRPWGSYDSVDAGERYQVKRISVAPGQKLSVQMHHHRAEHWIVVSGTALVRVGDKNLMLTENQSTYIPLGVVHSLENPGKIPLDIIEVQSGSYLGEDDIVRFTDVYGRVDDKHLQASTVETISEG